MPQQVQRSLKAIFLTIAIPLIYSIQENNNNIIGVRFPRNLFLIVGKSCRTPYCCLIVYFTNNIFGMSNEENQGAIGGPNESYNPENNLLTNLLEEAVTDREVFHSYPTVSLKQQAFQEQQGQENQRFDLRSIEKQEFNRTFPEKLFTELREDDALQITIGFRKYVPDTILLQKKCAPINKAAYLKESREDKLARYRQKKPRRLWQRKISYDCRKVVADKRQRKNGRFVRKEEDRPKKTALKSGEPKIQINAKQQGLSFKVQQYYD